MGVLTGIGIFGLLIGLAIMIVNVYVGFMIAAVSATWAVIMFTFWALFGSARLASKIATPPVPASGSDTEPAARPANKQMNNGLAIFIALAVVFVALIFSQLSDSTKPAALPPEQDIQKRAEALLTTQKFFRAQMDLNRTLRVQTHLNGLGYDPGPLDGVMGRKTRAAIEDFQRSNGLLVDGAVTDALLEALKGAQSQIAAVRPASVPQPSSPATFLSTERPSSTAQSQASGKAGRFRELRNQAISMLGWVAGNSYAHPIWPEMKPYIGRGGEYYDFFLRLTPPGLDRGALEAEAFQNVSLYRKWFDSGQSRPFDEADKGVMALANNGCAIALANTPNKFLGEPRIFFTGPAWNRPL